MWTLAALAVRIARAMGLHLESDRAESIFSREQRRRLWCTICIMDLQASFEQASEPLIDLDLSQSAVLPRNVNDADFDPATDDEPQERDDLTDMTFALVTYHAQLSGRLLNFAATDDGSKTTDGSGDLQLGRAAGARRALRGGGTAAAALLRRDYQPIRLVRPPRHPVAGGIDAAFGPPAAVQSRQRRAAPCEGAARTSCASASTCWTRLTASAPTPAARPSAGYVTIQWHALAIAITECYACTDTALLRSAWPVIEAMYGEHSTVIARIPRLRAERPAGEDHAPHAREGWRPHRRR